MTKSAIDDETRIKAIDLMRSAVGRLQRVHDSPQMSSHLGEADIALADLRGALKVLNELSDTDRRRALPDLRLLVYKLDGIDEPNISEAHDDILEACLLMRTFNRIRGIQVAVANLAGCGSAPIPIKREHSAGGNLKRRDQRTLMRIS